ncbi:hypothetical protein ES708_12713 [subsurface metagenome]
MEIESVDRSYVPPQPPPEPPPPQPQNTPEAPPPPPEVENLEQAVDIFV